jgi:hypothetical protein
MEHSSDPRCESAASSKATEHAPQKFVDELQFLSAPEQQDNLDT